MRKTCIYVNVIGRNKGVVCERWCKSWREGSGKPPLCFLHKRYEAYYIPEPVINSDEDADSEADTVELHNDIEIEQDA